MNLGSSALEPVEVFRAAALGSSRPTLLVVDDEEGPRQSLKLVFKDDYEVLLASDPIKALELAKTHHIDAAILDILMPGISGVELLNRLKEIDPSIEVIMLTAFETIETARQSMRYGACDYLNKPFEIPTIRASVSRAVERHRAALKLNATNNELVNLQREIRDRRLEEEMVRTKGEIYASVLHDINSPLTVISGFVEMISRSLEHATSVEGDKLNSIRGDLHKLTGQVGRCFEISRRYLGFLNNTVAEHPAVGVNQILADLKELLQRHPAAKHHYLTIDELPGDTIAEINGTDFLQILLNLTMNALQCTETPHRVQITCQRISYPLDDLIMRETNQQRFINREGFINHPPMIAISVEDNGPGIAPEDLRRMFEVQFTTKSVGKGTGLGLSIVKRLTKAAHGAVRVQTREHYGSTFTVYVPTFS
jgi:two-component system sensor histidine kinase/response regulator